MNNQRIYRGPKVRQPIENQELNKENHVNNSVASNNQPPLPNASIMNGLNYDKILKIKQEQMSNKYSMPHYQTQEIKNTQNDTFQTV